MSHFQLLPTQIRQIFSSFANKFPKTICFSRDCRQVLLLILSESKQRNKLLLPLKSSTISCFQGVQTETIQLAFTFSKSTIETRERNEVVLLLTLNIFHTILKSFHCRLWTSKFSKTVVWNGLTLLWRRSLSYRNQSIAMQDNTMDWFYMIGTSFIKELIIIFC